jgi:hypothetical protein
MTALPWLVSKRFRLSVEPDLHRCLPGEGHPVAEVARHGEFARDHPVLPDGARLNGDDVELRVHQYSPHARVRRAVFCTTRPSRARI